jgi:hypothetical protein
MKPCDALRFLVGLLILCGSASSENYDWPLEAPPALTSTYAEYRSGRFHAGLDVKTWGKEGLACVAVADGYVWRVRTSPWGYGRAVYIRLQDGRTAVYAHLSEFVERIEKVVAEEQDRRGAYSVNLYLPAGEIPVRRGDRIAFSGSTGSGFPHLHFEIRDRQQRPLNPLINGFDVKDTTDPTLVEVAFLPLDADSRVDGRAVPGFRTLKQSVGNDFAGDPVSLWGRVGVAVKVFDRADASALTNRLAPYRLTMSVDNQILFRTTYGAFSYDQVYEVDLDRSFVLNRQGRKGFHNLYLERGNSLPLYDNRPVGSGVIVAGTDGRKPGSFFASGPHTLRISAEDAAGNRSDATLDFTIRRTRSFDKVVIEDIHGERVLGGRFSQPLTEPNSVIVESSKDGQEAWQWIKTVRVKGEGFSMSVSRSSGPFYRVRFDGGPTAICSVPQTESGSPGSLEVNSVMYEGRSILTITSSIALASPPTVARHPHGQVEVHALSPSEYEAVIPISAGESIVTIRTRDVRGNQRDTIITLLAEAIRPTGGSIASADGMATAVFEPATIYHDFEGRIVQAVVPLDVASPVGAAYRFEPGVVPFRQMVQIHLKVPPGQDHAGLGVYELTEGGWSFVWNDVDSTRNSVWAGVRHFSVYALLRDEVPPEVEIRHPRDGVTTTPLPTIEVGLRDSLSGIPMENLISFKLDGQTTLFEYDPEEDVAKGILRQPLTVGSHELEVRVRDTCGNESVAISRFVVSD